MSNSLAMQTSTSHNLQPLIHNKQTNPCHEYIQETPILPPPQSLNSSTLLPLFPSISSSPHLQSPVVGYLARKHRRSRRRIRLLSIIQIIYNPHIILLIRARKANRRRSLTSFSTNNINLRTFLPHESAHLVTPFANSLKLGVEDKTFGMGTKGTSYRFGGLGEGRGYWDVPCKTAHP